MVVDAMLEADAEMRIAERIADPDLFVTLDDTLLKQIEWHGLLPGLVRPVLLMLRLYARHVHVSCTVGLPGPFVPEMATRYAAQVVEREGPLRKAKALLQRLRERDLYRYVDAVQVPVAALRMNTCAPCCTCLDKSLRAAVSPTVNDSEHWRFLAEQCMPLRLGPCVCIVALPKRGQELLLHGSCGLCIVCVDVGTQAWPCAACPSHNACCIAAVCYGRDKSLLSQCSWGACFKSAPETQLMSVTASLRRVLCLMPLP